MGNNTHVTNVSGLVHEGPDLIYTATSALVSTLAAQARVLLAYGEVTGRGNHISASRRALERNERYLHHGGLVFTGVMIHWAD